MPDIVNQYQEKIENKASFLDTTATMEGLMEAYLTLDQITGNEITGCRKKLSS